LPVYQEIPSFRGGYVADGCSLRQLGFMDSRHRWEALDLLTWAVPEPLRPTDPLSGHVYDARTVSLPYRRVVFRMKEIRGAQTIPHEPAPLHAALIFEDGLLEDIFRIPEFSHEESRRALTIEDLEATRDLLSQSLTGSIRTITEMVNRYADRQQRSFFETVDEVRPFPINRDPAILRWREMYQAAVGTRMGRMTATEVVQGFPSSPEPPSVEDIADATAEQAAMDEARTRADLIGVLPTEIDRGFTNPDADEKAPRFAKALAPLPDWLKKVDDIIEEVKDANH
jgi:hypothetical protein